MKSISMLKVYILLMLMSISLHINSQTNVLICGSPGDPNWLNDVQAKVQSTGFFTSVQIFNTSSATPTLAFLQTFQAVMVFTDGSPIDPTTLGNNLAAYVNGGGGVVSCVFTNASVPIAGAFNTTTYQVVVPDWQIQGTPLTLGTVIDPNHPIMHCVTNLSGGSSSFISTSTTFTPGTQVVANWSNGSWLAAYKLNVGPALARRADLNLYPPSSDARSDFWTATTQGALLMGNALRWVSGANPTPGPPAQPGAISGPVSICQGATATYSIAPVSNAVSYTWTVPGGTVINSGQGTTSITVTAGATSGTISVSAVNGCGSSAPNSLSVTINPLPVASISGTNTICAGQNTTFTASGGGTYAWSTGATTSSITASIGGVYTVTVTSTAGCTSTANVTLTVNPLPVAAISGTNTLCAGQSTTLTASGGVAYAWSTGANTASITVTPPNSVTYTCTVTSAAGCTATAVQAVTVNPLPIAAISGTNTICAGQSTTLTASGGGTYAWSTGATSAAITVTPPTTTVYTCTVTSAAGCTATATRTVTVNPLPVAAISGVNTICAGQNTTFTASGGGTYAWSTGATTAAITASTGGVYTVTVTSTAGCTSTANVTLTVNPLPVAAISGTNTICAGQNTTFTASGGGTYAWSTGATTSSITASTGGVYTVTVTSIAGCTASANVTLTVNPLPSVTAATANSAICIGGSTTLTGGGANTYVWNPGNLSGSNVTVSPTSSTTYTVTGTNANGCVNTATVAVTVNPLPTVTASAANGTICDGSSETLTAGGASIYSWSSGGNTATEVVSPTSSTTYTVTGTDVNGCVNTATVAVTVNALPNVTASAANGAICDGSSETLTAGGASTYAWSSGGTAATEIVSPTSTTTYTVTGTDVNGCVNTATVAVTVNALPNVTATVTNGTICDGSSETLTAGGADTYAWSSGGTAATETVSPNTTTTYTVTGTDVNGCVNTATVTVNVNALPNVTASAMISTICDGTNDTLMAAGADTYVWSSGGTTDTEVVAPNTTTTYTVTGTDVNGCVNTATVTVNVNALPTVTASAMMSTICEGTNDTLMATGADTYVWSSGGNTDMEIVTPNATTTYTVTGTDVNGCVNTATVTVNVNPVPVVNLGADIAQCGGSVTLDAQNAGASFVWSDNSTGQTLVVSASGTYAVVVTDANGCEGTDTIVVAINDFVTVNLGVDSTQCGGTITLDAQNAGASYVWSDNSTNQTLVVSASGTYFVDVTDINGCEGSDTVNVVINTPPTVTGTASATTVCLDDADVTLTGAPAGGSWAGPGVSGTNFDPSVGAGAQTLTYSFTDNNGCSGTATVTVTVDACVGVAENTLAEGVNVYPNPNNGVFTLAINANVGDVVIEMVDMQGRLVYAANENNVQAGFIKQISLETQASGLYMIRLTSATEQHTLRVNVQK